MNINSKMASVAVVSAIAGATFLGANSASAHSSGESLVSRISERFGVSETEVQAVVDEVKEEHQAERAAERDEHLQGLVDEGVLTAEQRADLDTFSEERQTQREELMQQDLSKAEIREAMEGLRDEVEAWAEAEGLDIDDLKPEKEGRRSHGHRGELRERMQAEFGEDAEDSDEVEDVDTDES